MSQRLYACCYWMLFENKSTDISAVNSSYGLNFSPLRANWISAGFLAELQSFEYVSQKTNILSSRMQPLNFFDLDIFFAKRKREAAHSEVILSKGDFGARPLRKHQLSQLTLYQKKVELCQSSHLPRNDSDSILKCHTWIRPVTAYLGTGILPFRMFS